MSIGPQIHDFLAERDLPFEVLTHDRAYTALEEAATAHVSGYDWAKTVVVIADGNRPVMAVLPAVYEVDLDRLQHAMGVDELRLADEAEFEDLYPGCERGAMPPLGPLYGQPVWVDRHLAEDQNVTFNGGTHTDAVRMRFRDFARAVKPRIGDFGRRSLVH